MRKATAEDLTCADLEKLDDQALFNYFCKHAKYDKCAEKGYEYSIRHGSTALFSGDTRKLFLKFERRVRVGVSPWGFQ